MTQHDFVKFIWFVGTWWMDGKFKFVSFSTLKNIAYYSIHSVRDCIVTFFVVVVTWPCPIKKHKIACLGKLNFDSETISCPMMAFHEVVVVWLQPKGNKLHVHMQIKGSNMLFIFSFLLIILYLFLLIFKGLDFFELLPLAR